MIKILSSGRIKELDAYTIEHEPIASIDLMERACQAFVQWFTGRFDASKRVGIVCGTGNNGGDGLGVARLLSDWGYPVSIWIVRGGQESADFIKNFKRLPPKVMQFEILPDAAQDTFKTVDILVDAIFGSGLARPIEGTYEKVVNCMNSAGRKIVSIDIPSGLFADQHTTGPTVCADYTVSFQLPKLGFLLPENERVVGQVEIVDIGLSKAFLKEVDSDHFMVDEKSAKRLLKERSKFSHKGNYGKALLISGSFGKMGACVLAARAAMRAGTGLLTVHVPAAGYSIIQSTVPEAMASVDGSHNVFSVVPDLLDYDSIGIGPGIGKHADTVKAMGELLESYQKPMVFDADALNILSENGELQEKVPAFSVLTPHPGEFRRLVGEWTDDFDKLSKGRSLAKRLNTVVVLKGAHSMIFDPGGKVYFNSTGNPGMATGGSGDVLTGILTGLLAQGYLPLEATLLGVFLHGLAGDKAASDLGKASMIASDIIEYLPQAFRRLS